MSAYGRKFERRVKFKCILTGPIPLNESKSWDDYWTGSSSGVAFSSEGAQHPQLGAFWAQAFGEVDRCQRLLDVASGRGAVLEYLRTSDLKPEEVFAVDYSAAGLSSLRENFPQVLVTAADAAAPAFAPGSMSLVVSQFGVEYAGQQGLLALPELVASGGEIILITHAEGSVIYEECRANRDALAALEQLNFLSYAEDMFQSGYMVIRGQIGRKEAGAMARRVIEPFNGLREIMDRYGEDVAGGTIRTLYEETARIQQRFQYHLEDEVMGWIRSMKHEVRSYSGRMNSMLNAALSESALSEIVDAWAAMGCQLLTCDALKDASQRQLAWAVRVTKS